MKRFTALMVVFSICLLLITPASASGSFTTQSNFHSKLMEALQEISPQKAVWGLENVEFENLSIGSPVHTYCYVDNTLVPGQLLYPITEDQQLVLWAIEQNGEIQLSNGLVSEVNNAITVSTAFSIIYDAVGTHIYTNEGVEMISEHPEAMSDRSTLPSSISLDEENIATVTLAECTSVGYVSARNMPTTVACSVSRVVQTGSNTCWAATIACIYNYLAGTSLTEQNVVNICLGNPSIDQSATVSNLRLWLPMFGELRYYDDEYVFGSTGSFDDIDIYYSIYAGYPVYGIFYNASNISREHAGTIYSCNIIAGRMSVMDPYSGAHTATMNSQSGTYSYYSTTAGVTYHLILCFSKE